MTVKRSHRESGNRRKDASDLDIYLERVTERGDGNRTRTISLGNSGPNSRSPASSPWPAEGRPASVLPCLPGFPGSGGAIGPAWFWPGAAVVLLIASAPPGRPWLAPGLPWPVPRSPARGIAAPRWAEAVQAQASRLRDLDETRRLADAILHARRSRDEVIIATLADALACQGLAADPRPRRRARASVLNAPALPQKVSNGSSSRLTALGAGRESPQRQPDHDPASPARQYRPVLGGIQVVPPWA
jgi:hypothetical protein